MSAAKSAAGALFGLVGLGISGFGATQTMAQRPAYTPSVIDVALRPWPAMQASAAAVAVPKPEAAKPEPAAVEPAKTEPAKAEVPPEPVKAEPAKVEPAKPAPEPAKTAAETPKPPAPVAAPVKVEPAKPPPPAAVANGVLNLRASDTADVFVDGRKAGTTPVTGFKAKVGKHTVRFDCYDAAGNTVPGAPQTADIVSAGDEVDLDFKCPE